MKKTYLAIVPARDNSKRIRNKNLKKINNKTLIDYTVLAALKSKKISKVCISTNIKRKFNYASNRVIQIKRPKNLCTDFSPTEKTILHSITHLKNKNLESFDNIILLQPTSPFRSAKDINSAIKIFEKSNADSLFSGIKTKLFIWKKKKNFNSYNFNYKKRKRTQEMQDDYVENGAISIFKTNKFMKSKNRMFGKIAFYEMSLLNSFEIDNLNDLKIARKIAKLLINSS